MNIGSEVGDLVIFLCIVCVPLAVGAVFIPIGLALAERIRSDRTIRDDRDAVIRALQDVDARLSAMEFSAARNSTALEALAAHRLPLVPLQGTSTTPRPTTPRSTTPH